ncbi:uncharacterized protein ARMOST_06246 [Armillaria ostoyae]|uniref:Uncharacterized protein n=1 Tax=Armillaria ostoyae TaxID=47428 RepID=A0A284R2I9_ARMOS|nr:uncharacterized protein ARMOST_06246 [Armillaria ostoyae]
MNTKQTKGFEPLPPVVSHAIKKCCPQAKGFEPLPPVAPRITKKTSKLKSASAMTQISYSQVRAQVTQSLKQYTSAAFTFYASCDTQVTQYVINKRSILSLEVTNYS